MLVTCALESPKTQLPVGDYAAFFSITSESGTAARSIAKLTRPLAALRGEPSGRVVFERIVGAHKPVIIWGAEEVVSEQYGLRIPADLPPGTTYLIGEYELARERKILRPRFCGIHCTALGEPQFEEWEQIAEDIDAAEDVEHLRVL